MAERGHSGAGRSTPTEGALAYVSGFVIPKNAPNKDGSYAYLDAMLEKSAQEAFAVDMGYNPTVTNAVVAPDLNKRIGFTPDEIKKLVDLDYDYMTQERRRAQGMVGQGAEGLSAASSDSSAMARRPLQTHFQSRREADVVALGDDAARAGDGVRGRRASGAAGDPVPLQLQQVRAARASWSRHSRSTITSSSSPIPIYTDVLCDDAAGGRALHRRLPRHGSAARLRAGAHPVAVTRTC